VTYLSKIDRIVKNKLKEILKQENPSESRTKFDSYSIYSVSSDVKKPTVEVASNKPISTRRNVRKQPNHDSLNIQKGVRYETHTQGCLEHPQGLHSSQTYPSLVRWQGLPRYHPEAYHTAVILVVQTIRVIFLFKQHYTSTNNSPIDKNLTEKTGSSREYFVT
jgi:hypothetical protein